MVLITVDSYRIWREDMDCGCLGLITIPDDKRKLFGRTPALPGG